MQSLAEAGRGELQRVSECDVLDVARSSLRDPRVPGRQCAAQGQGASL